MKFLKKFDTSTNKQEYLNSSTKILPCLTYCENEKESQYIPDDKLIVYYDISTYLTNIKIVHNFTSSFSKIVLDGEDISSPQDVLRHNFDTSGLYKAEFTLLPNASLYYAFQGCNAIAKVKIPYGITQISQYAFEGCDLKELILPNSVISFGQNAFSSNYNLKSVTLSRNLQSIGRYSFIWNRSLEYLYLPESVQQINSGAFDHTTLKNIVIPRSITYIQDSAFYNTSLINVTMFNGIETLGKYAFMDCKYLETINSSVSGEYILPNTITKLDGSVFYGCEKLKYIKLSKNNVSIGDFVFAKTGLLSLEIPDSNVSIGQNCFNSTPLQDLSIGKGLTGIGSQQFDSNALTKLTLNNDKIVSKTRTTSSNIRTIMSHLPELTELVIGNDVSVIGNYAFYNTSNNLTTVRLSNNLKTIGTCAFQNCNKLTTIIFPDSLTTIGGSAFYNCSINTINIPKNLNSIGVNAFYNCPINTITIDNNHPIYKLQNNCLIHKSSNSINLATLNVTEIPEGLTSLPLGIFKNNANFTDVTIPDTITTINSEAFGNCPNITSLTIPETTTTIGQGITRYCYNLSSITVEPNNPNYDSRNNCNAIINTSTNTLIQGCKTTTIPNNIVKIDSYAFIGQGITDLTIPTSVTNIGSYAFMDCSSLTSVTLPNTLKTLGTKCFHSCTSLTSIIIPASVAASSFSGSTTSPGLFYNCTNLTSVTINSSVVMANNYNSNIRLVNIFGNQVTEFTIGNDVSKLGNYAFNGFINLTTVTLSNNLKTIGNYVFNGCSSLTSLTLPSTVTSIGSTVFTNCTSLTGITILATTPPTLGGNSFNNTNNCSIYVPAASVDTYKAATNWSALASRIQAIS